MRLGTIAFLVGVVIALQFAHLPQIAWSFLLVPLLLVLLRFPHVNAVVLLFCGMLWLSLRASILIDGTLTTELEGRDAIIEGSIVSIPVLRADSSRFIFSVENMHVEGRAVTQPKRIKLSWYGHKPLKLASGQRWRLTVRLKRPYGMMNPGGFDYERWLFQQGIGATGYVRNASTNTQLNDRDKIFDMTNAFYRLRQHLSDRINQLAGNSDQVGIIQALALGERGQISPDQWQRLQDTGTNHLVAISGLHIGLVSAWVFFVSRWLWPRSLGRYLNLAAPRAAAICGWVAAVLYAALAGFSIPTQRALVMVTVVMLGVITQRPIALSHVWALSLLAVLIYDPLAPLSAGFWLSYAAVGVILFGLGNRLTTTSLWWRFGRVHIVVALGLAPLLILLFQNIPVLSPLANFIAVPLVSLVTVPATLLAMVFIDLWPIFSEGLLLIAHYSLVILQKILTILHPYSSLPINLPVLNIFTLSSLVIGTLWLLTPKGWPTRWLGVVGFLPLFFFTVDRPKEGTFWLSVLDVGQGTSIVVTTKNHTLVYDTGARFSDQFDMGSAVVLPYLRALSDRQVDMLIVSHEDNDHMGGAASIIAAGSVKQVLSSAPDKFAKDVAKPCVGGESWQWDGIHFELFHPDANYRVKNKRTVRNNRSCVLRVSNGSEAVLLPGDIEKDAERYLMTHYRDRLSADIVVAPHHGSRTSSTQSFINNINPDYVIYTVGYRNRYGFPKSQVTERYDGMGAKAYRTDDSGALRFILDGEGEIAPPTQYRQEQRRFWHTIR
ncbi:MAG: DNA internalization-related competence protein ComEC/Rec2 [Gammaproteobacteria bacterium]|nr:DNA internalization-related competence protein ComEC/Rec2 [Gammaproteobacteria bacterium]